jgi:hypothetical protein
VLSSDFFFAWHCLTFQLNSERNAMVTMRLLLRVIQSYLYMHITQQYERTNEHDPLTGVCTIAERQREREDRDGPNGNNHQFFFFSY